MIYNFKNASYLLDYSFDWKISKIYANVMD